MPRSLKGAMALSLLTLLVVWLVLWRFRPSNGVAIAGAVASFAAMTFISGWHRAVVLGWRPDQDWPLDEEEARTAERWLYWPARLLDGALPGLWIGLTARAPLPVALGYWLVREVVVCLPFLLPPPPPEELRPSRIPLESFLVSLALVLASTAMGVLLRGGFSR